MMSTTTLVLGLLVAVTALALAARAVKMPYPTVMVLGGLAIGYVPHLMHVELNPELFFSLIMPPLLYAAAWTTSWQDFRSNLRPITMLATGFVLFTTAAVAWCAHAVVPGMPWPAAFALGAIVSPPDAVAATAVVQPLGIPRRIVAILEGESLVNDASGLTLYTLATAAAVTGMLSWHYAAALALWAVAGGVGCGLLFGYLIMKLHQRIEDPLIETVITLLTPNAAFIATDAMHASGVLAVVSMGLYVSRNSHRIFSSTTRLYTVHVWQVVIFVLNGLVFVLVGLQWPIILQQIKDADELHLPLLGWSVGLCVLLLVVRMAWVFPGSYLPRMFSKKLRERDPNPPWTWVFMIAYCGMRGTVSLAAAVALPLAVAGGAPFPHRALIIFLTFIAILATLVLQSLTLPWLVRKLNLRETAHENRSEEWEARLRAAEAAITHIDQRQTNIDMADLPSLLRLRARYEERVDRLSAISKAEEDGRCATEEEVEIDVYQAVLATERKAIIGLRDAGKINDEVSRRIELDLDLEEARLNASTSRG